VNGDSLAKAAKKSAISASGMPEFEPAGQGQG
jgi:hypothetical protein